MCKRVCKILHPGFGRCPSSEQHHYERQRDALRDALNGIKRNGFRVWNSEDGQHEEGCFFDQHARWHRANWSENLAIRGTIPEATLPVFVGTLGITTCFVPWSSLIDNLLNELYAPTLPVNHLD